jgi:hypothetical protein
MINNLFAVIYKSFAQSTIVPLRIKEVVFTNSSLKDIRNNKFIISEEPIFIKWMSCKTNSPNMYYNINNSMHIKKSYANGLIRIYKYIIEKIKIVLYQEFLFIQVFNPASCDFIFTNKRVLYSCI